VKRLIALIASFVLLVAPSASAQTVSEVVAGLGDDGVYVDPGLSVDLEDLRDAVETARDAGFGLYVVLLDENPPSGATAFADSVLNQLGTGTVLVLSASAEGMSSTQLDAASIRAALDAGFEAGGGDEGYVAGLVEAVTGETVRSSSSSSTSGDGGGGSGLVIMLVIVGGLVLLVWWAIRRSSKASKERRGSLLDEARGEIKEQLDSMANTILEITDLVSASDAEQDDDYLGQAGATYTAAFESYESANDLGALEELSDQLDVARWQLDAATAISEGRAVPPKPEKKERPVCFFDPTHRDATEMVDIQTASGTRAVRVCRADADRIKRGNQPKPRMIEYQGRRVPAPMAPRSHGGGGMDWLETFSILAGGAGQAMSYDWGSGRRRTPSRRSGRSSGPRVRSQPKRSRAGRTRRRRR
jgi:hypothetical protein